MTKEEFKKKLKDISEKVLTVVEKLDDCCGKQGFCEDCPINISENTCCLIHSQIIYNNIIELLKEKKNDRKSSVKRN